MDQVEPRSGTFSDWNINVAGVQGQQGPTGGAGPAGAQGNTGPIGPGYAAGSSTSLPIATGSISVATQSGLAYTAGARVRLASNGTPTAWMEGSITSYSGSTMVVNVDTISTAIAPIVFPMLPGYIGGLTLANDATTPNTVLDIALGAATSDDYSTLMQLATVNFTKNCNAAWAVGSGLGALDVGTSLAASTWYHVYLIERVDTFVTDVLISTSATNPILPANYTKRRRIGSICTDSSSHIIPFIQVGDEFLWNRSPAAPWEVSDQPIGTTAGFYTVNVPTGIKVIAILNYVGSRPGGMVNIHSGDTLPGATGSWNANFTAVVYANNSTWLGGALRLRTNVSAQIGAVASVSQTLGFFLSAQGWVNNRGK